MTDQVMGGVSTGRISFEEIEGRRCLCLDGDVSLDNNGGFIQVRQLLPSALPEGAEGIALRVRGNGQTYFVHLRTSGTRLPWQYYQASFNAGADWTEVRLPFTAFEPSGRLLRSVPKPGSVKSIGLVAYGRDHAADVSLAEVRFY